MNVFHPVEYIPLPCPDDHPVRHMAFDGCFYYFTTCDCRILKTDLCFEHTQCIQTNQVYACLCYDQTEHCFWATSEKCVDKLFKLSSTLRETGCIELRLPCEERGVITGLSFNCCDNSLLMAVGQTVFAVKKCGMAQKICTVDACRITSVTSICPGIVLTAIRDKRQYIYIVNCGEVIHCEAPDWCGCITAMVLHPCCRHGKTTTFDFLTVKSCCCPHIIQTTAENLGYLPCCCNYRVCCDRDSKDPHAKDACADIMESVALVEAALSHILNAEGEKLQKVLDVSQDVEQILCANKEIGKTVISVTHLEQILYDKLALVSELCRPNDCCTPHVSWNHPPQCGD